MTEEKKGIIDQVKEKNRPRAEKGKQQLKGAIVNKLTHRKKKKR